MAKLLILFLILFIVLFVSSCLYYGAQKAGEWWRSRARPVEKNEEYDLTQLSKEDYDFLVENGLPPTPEAQAYFYPPPNAHELAAEENYRKSLAAEQRAGIAQQIEMLDEAKASRIYDDALKASWAAKNAPNREPVEWHGTWINTEKIRG